MVEEIDLHPARYRDTPVGIATNSAHNAILLAGAETGVVGAAATFALVAALALAAISWVLRGRRRDAFAWAACLSVLGLLAQAMFNNLLTVGVTSVLLTLLFGAFATGQTTGDVEGQRDP
jgi:O-antigen ligase